MLTLRWLKEQGGVAAMEKINDQKANLLYSFLETIPFINLPVAKEDRSKMNVVFTMNNEQLEKEFQQTCKEQNLYGVKGHRSVGGFRMSLYNALPISSVEYAIEVIKQFATQKG
jgi:phosphoserine aminotransferase